MRKYSLVDNLINNVDYLLKIPMKKVSKPTRVSPAANIKDPSLSLKEKALVCGLMRVNLCGEICAQALYQAQALNARTLELKQHFLDAAEEEKDHLSWCHMRIKELGGHSSLLNPVWYFSAFSLGFIMSLPSDEHSLGFLYETEKQVAEHLEKHLKLLPITDEKSRAILCTMLKEEQAHSIEAKNKGGKDLNLLLPLIMKAQAKIMTTLSRLI
ncbi:MAG: 2-octaprenyl-3-methyl-6-methoxy,4-benzoquinol hydroxylase [Francisellaceae bacterium]|nr:2-octaprenyl-3-methyl-6-methoxy,4-benzoquinol hydroxylase [Francisellaceae bacterium]